MPLLDTTLIRLPSESLLAPRRDRGVGDRTLTVLGVRIMDVSMSRALDIVREMMDCGDGRTRGVYFVNANALNVAASNEAYRDVLNQADCVFADGTGVRWAAKLQGIRLRDNVNGTDLVPLLLGQAAGPRRRYFLLGADEETIRRAAAHAARAFPDWTLAGYHHGFLTTPEMDARAVALIRQARPDLLLVGMGNPLQESWIHRHRDRIDVPVCLGVGGLFQYWAGTIQRAPRWLRGRGFEWLGILVQQPAKARRYLLGNPLFLARVSRDTWKLRRRQPRQPHPHWPNRAAATTSSDESSSSSY